MNKIIKGISISLLSFSVFSCSTALDLLNQVFQKPEFLFKSFNINQFDLEKVGFDLKFDIDNPNAVAINTSKANYNFALNGNNLFSGDFEEGISVKANEKSEVNIPISLNISKLFPILQNIFSNPETLDYKVDGAFNFDSPIGSIPINWEKEDKVEVPKLEFQEPKVEVTSFKFDKIDLDKTIFSLNLAMDNPNPLEISTSDDSKYDLEINGKKLISTNLTSLKIDKNSKSELKIPIEINTSELAGFAAQLLLNGGKFDYKLNGLVGFNTPLGDFPIKTDFSSTAN